jgi:hypothetical protein
MGHVKKDKKRETSWRAPKKGGKIPELPRRASPALEQLSVVSTVGSRPRTHALVSKVVSTVISRSLSPRWWW